MTLDSVHGVTDITLSPDTVPLGEGPPTKEQMLVYYPAKFTWKQIKTFVNSGDLGLLKRSRTLQKRYDAWSVGIKEEYGSMVNYLLSYRLQWGKPDTLSKLPSRLGFPRDVHGLSTEPQNGMTSNGIRHQASIPTVPPDAPTYFTADIRPELISIIQNDWPYSVPSNIEHTLIWTVVSILPPYIPSAIKPRLHQDGLWGFTGYPTNSPPPSPSLLSNCLPALAEWGVTEDKLVRSVKGNEDEERAVREVGKEIQTFVKKRWGEEEWETAWFVNPPRLQSVPGLAHIHVFARYKRD
ncbi:hypothetical protein OF83DRAFT_1232317 [Amylostereum chailletii]|nr:hypothetical protein OF83DRAFT_1232317 [Amylostereum chailletii]